MQFLVTNFPTWELNHTVLAYDVPRRRGRQRASSPSTTRTIPHAPGRITFDRTERRFVATRLHDTEQGPIRAFRMYYWALL